MSGTGFVYATLTAYGAAAAAYVLLALRIGVGFRRSRHGTLLLAAVVATAVWAAALVVFATLALRSALSAAVATDVVRQAFWYALIGSLLAGSREEPSQRGLPQWLVGFATALLLSGLVVSVVTFGVLEGEAGLRWYFAFQLAMAVTGLVLVEQLYRRAHPDARWGIKPLVLMLAAMWALELVLYADALLFARLDPDIWLARGLSTALLVPFIVVATARNANWTIEMHLSREAVFQSTALLVAGLVLLLFAGAGYIVRYAGGEWGRALQIEMLFLAAVVVGLAVTSGRFRSRLRVFISKHFFSYRYDYREEWLRFTRTLSTESPVVRTQERAIMALADLVESPGGALWLASDGAYRPAARLNVPAADAAVALDAPLPAFLQRTGWIIGVRDVRDSSDAYEGLVLPDWLLAFPGAWLVVPLSTSEGLIGFVLLVDPRSPVEVDWEVRDLLKAAARAAASYLSHIRMNEALLEARKFDAFNRMSAFVVHDLKNLVAQLSLMLRNAERHSDNPAFRKDMLETVEHVVTRMNSLMLQLRSEATPVESARPVDLEPIVRRVLKAKGVADRVDADLAPGIMAMGHEDRLEHVIAHLLQNALDATAQGGDVGISTRRDGAAAVIEVRDAGVGMSPEFVRDRLFRPFETTKASGMGIGVYESRQYVLSVGGQISVSSEPEKGTEVRVTLPLASNMAHAHASVQEAA